MPKSDERCVPLTTLDCPIEAKVYTFLSLFRQILDLEITNKSLLAINATLERTKLSQATELRDLRRAVREGHFSTSSSALPLHTAPLLGSSSLNPFSPLKSPDLDYFPDEEEEDLPWEEVLALDPGFGEVVRNLETLHVRALQAVLKSSTAASSEVGGKVLSQFDLERHRSPTMMAGRPPLSPGKSGRSREVFSSPRRKGRTMSDQDSLGQEATPRLKQGSIQQQQDDSLADTSPDISTSVYDTSAAADETGTTDATTGDEASASSSYLIEDSIADERSRTSSAHTAEMSLGVD